MNLMLKRLEALAAFCARKFSVLAVVSALMVVIVLIIDAMYGLTWNLQGKLVKAIGKFFGSAGLAIALVAAAYYILREAYVRAKKKGVALPNDIDNGLKSLLNITRSIHPYTGFLVICSIMLHGYLMAFVWLAAKGAWTVWSGAVAFGALVVAGAVGWLIRLNQPALALRKYHRYIGMLFFVLYFVHKALAD